MKKILLSAMMIMVMMCATTNASAQDHKCDKQKKECCEKKDAKASCGGNCEKCTECKATCSKTNCKDCKHKGQCKKNCKK